MRQDSFFHANQIHVRKLQPLALCSVMSATALRANCDSFSSLSSRSLRSMSSRKPERSNKVSGTFFARLENVLTPFFLS